MEGVNFVTEPEHNQQVAYMGHKKGTKIAAHFHNPVERIIYDTQEVLVVKRGKLRCDLYDNDQRNLQSITLDEGDVIVLLNGGHGFLALEDIELIEIKQGPFVGGRDKTRFEPSEPGTIYPKSAN